MASAMPQTAYTRRASAPATHPGAPGPCVRTRAHNSSPNEAKNFLPSMRHSEACLWPNRGGKNPGDATVAKHRPEFLPPCPSTRHSVKVPRFRPYIPAKKEDFSALAPSRRTPYQGMALAMPPSLNRRVGLSALLPSTATMGNPDRSRETGHRHLRNAIGRNLTRSGD